MKGELILGGGGDDDQEVLYHFTKGINTLLYIPIAMDSIPYNECFNWCKEHFKRYNLTITMLDDLSKPINLNDYDAIYIGGGNTFKLLKEIKQHNFDKKIINFYKEGGKIGGGSAGSIIFGKTIDTAKFGDLSDENIVNLKDLRGLNLVKNYNIQVHYTSKQKEQLQKYVEKTNIPIIALPDESGIIVKDNKIFPIGKIYYING